MTTAAVTRDRVIVRGAATGDVEIAQGRRDVDASGRRGELRTGEHEGRLAGERGLQRRDDVRGPARIQLAEDLGEEPRSLAGAVSRMQVIHTAGNGAPRSRSRSGTTWRTACGLRASSDR